MMPPGRFHRRELPAVGACQVHSRRALRSWVRIHDYLDAEVPVLARMFRKRLRGYGALGYERADDASASALPRELAIDYDS